MLPKISCPGWKERILKARDEDSFNEDDHERAFSWSQCLVGEYLQLASLEDNSLQGGLGTELTRIGIGFMVAVEENKIGLAVELYNELTGEKI